MTVDAGGRQGIIDFSRVLRESSSRRVKLKPHEGVPDTLVKILNDVRRVCGIKLTDINEKTGQGTSYLSKTLAGKQPMSHMEYQATKNALADLVFQKVLDAADREGSL